eukprot:6461706-Amphidinium_carterae.3
MDIWPPSGSLDGRPAAPNKSHGSVPCQSCTGYDPATQPQRVTDGASCGSMQRLRHAAPPWPLSLHPRVQ